MSLVVGAELLGHEAAETGCIARGFDPHDYSQPPNPMRREVRHPRGVECSGVPVELTPDQIDFFDRHVVLAKDLPPFTFERLLADDGYLKNFDNGES